MIKLTKPKDFNLITPEEWFKRLLTSFIQVNRTNDVLFELDNNIYMKYNKEDHILWYDYSSIYSVLNEKFGINYEQMNGLIKDTAEANTNLQSITPKRAARWLLGGR